MRDSSIDTSLKSQTEIPNIGQILDTNNTKPFSLVKNDENSHSKSNIKN